MSEFSDFFPFTGPEIWYAESEDMLCRLTANEAAVLRLVEGRVRYAKLMLS